MSDQTVVNRAKIQVGAMEGDGGESGIRDRKDQSVPWAFVFTQLKKSGKGVHA